MKTYPVEVVDVLRDLLLGRIHAWALHPRYRAGRVLFLTDDGRIVAPDDASRSWQEVSGLLITLGDGTEWRIAVTSGVRQTL